MTRLNRVTIRFDRRTGYQEQACMFPKYMLIKDNKNELLISQLFPI